MELTPSTKEDIGKLKEDIGEMLASQTKTLIEYVDSAKKELKHDIVDLRGDMYVEIKKKVAEHVATQHA